MLMLMTITVNMTDSNKTTHFGLVNDVVYFVSSAKIPSSDVLILFYFNLAF